MAESLELWQRLGHASYRDWVLAAEKARRVAKAANKAAAKATALVQPSPTSALQPVPLPTLATPPLHRLPYREELVATPPEDRRLPKSYVSTGVCHPLSACRHGLVPFTATTACSEKGAAAAREAAAGVEMAESYLKDLKKQLPCAAFLDGEYDAKNIYAGVPVIIGSKGVEKIVKLNLSEDEKNNFKKSVDSVKELYNAAQKLDPDL